MNLTGFAAWRKLQFQEERGQALKAAKYLLPAAEAELVDDSGIEDVAGDIVSYAS